MRWGGASVLLVLAGVLSAPAFVGFLNTSGDYRRWALDPADRRVPTTAVDRRAGAIRVHLDEAGWSRTNAAAELDAVRAAFDLWQGVGGARIQFQEGALVRGTGDVLGQDGTNTVFWATNLFLDGGRLSLSGLLALTVVRSYTDGNVIFDADIAFNGVQFRWFTNPEEPAGSRAFVEAIALHEIGHLLGLRHSPIGGATMLAVGDFGVNSQVGLSADEQAAARALYGVASPSPAPGRLRGKVRLDGNGILGAAVFAEDAAGNLAAATVSVADGSYDLPGLLPAAYTVRVAPLDPISATTYLVRGLDIAADYAGARTDFLPPAETVVEIAAGKARTLDIAVTAGSPLRVVRLLRPSADLSSPSYNNKPVSVSPGGAGVWLGGLTPQAADPAMVLRVSGDGVAVGPTTVVANALGSLTLVAAPVTVGEGATPGLRSLGIGAGGQTAWAHGFLEVLTPFPDVNGDGFDDGFQRRYWTRFTASEAAPGSDPDGDGFSNAWEHATGTDPTDPASVRFAILSVQVSEAGARVRAETAAGRRFQLLTRETVPGSDWVAVGSSVHATGAEAEFLDGTATDRVRFYRVEMLP